MKKNIYLFLFCLLIPSFLSACSCLYTTSFCESTTNSAPVIRGEILNKYEAEGINGYDKTFYMDVLVVERILGDLMVDTISIINFGTSCDLNHDDFEIGDEVILNSIDENKIDDLSGHPFLSPRGCTSILLTLNDGIVNGLIRTNLTSQSLDDFKGDIGVCNDLTALDRDINEIDKRFFIFPNPSTENVFIVSGFSLNEKVTYELYDGVGQRVGNGKINLDDESKIEIKDYPRGVYILKINIKDQFLIRRILKN